MTAIPLSERQHWVGASESAALLGVSPFSTPFTLWHEKAGNIPREDLGDNERVQAGRFLEPAIAAWAGEKWTDWQPRKVERYLEHPTVPQMGASLDFEDAHWSGDQAPPIEIKNVDFLVFRDHWNAEGDVITDAPVHYLLQVQHQLACRPGAPHGWLLACVAGNRLYRMKIERHPGAIARLEAAVAAFWQSVRDNKPPKPDFAADGGTIAGLYATGNGEILDLTDNNRLPDLCAAYTAAKAQEKAGKTDADTALAEIKMIVGDAAGALASGYLVKAVDVAAGEVPAHTRNGYRRWTVKAKE